MDNMISSMNVNMHNTARRNRMDEFSGSLHVNRHTFKRPTVPAFMTVYKKLKFKMKLSYESWLCGLKLGQFLHMTIYKTIVERQRLAQYDLNEFTSNKEFNNQHNLFYKVSKGTASLSDWSRIAGQTWQELRNKAMSEKYQ